MKKIHYIPHTHWDREWYRSSNAFRIRLVYVFDKVLQLLEQEDELSFFSFDGQVAALEDYLEIKPEMKEKVQKLVTEKRLFIGPWYTQPDLFLTSNESILRNLIIGSNMAESLGHCMDVGWIPDAFGQIAATPQIFSELGMQSVFVWRGFDYEMIDDSVFLWKGPDGSKILTIHFPLGYGHYRYLPTENTEAKKEVLDIVQQLEPRFKENELLFMGGSDHAMPQEGVENILKEINEEILADDYQIEQSNPEKFTQAVKKQLEISPRKLMMFEGEARSAALGRIHAGISSTRIDIKNSMRKYETLLPRVCEPLTVMTSLSGGESDQRVLNHFWKKLFKNSFHDSIYASSPESVNQTVVNRLLDLRHGLNEWVWLQFRFLKNQLDLSSLKNEELIILFNTLPYKREDLVLVNVYTEGEFTLKTFDDKEVPYAIREHKEEVNVEIEDYMGLLHLNNPYKVQHGELQHTQVVISAKELPSLGYQAIKVCPVDQKANNVVETSLRVNNQIVENDYLKMSILEDGSLEVYHKESGQVFTNLWYFEEKGDAGDEYNYSPPSNDQIFTTRGIPAQIELLEKNPFEVIFKVTHRLESPLTTNTKIRSKEMVTNIIESEVRMTAESEMLFFETTIHNQSNDHQIRVIFDDVKSSEWNISEGHFGQVRRNNTISKEYLPSATEIELPIYPMNRYVYLEGESTLALLSGGPMEYEVYDNKKLTLTLLRSTGALGKSDLEFRPGRASGYHLSTPSSQLLESVTSNYGLAFGSKLNQSKLSRAADQLTVPIQSRQLKDLTRKENNKLPAKVSFLEISTGLEMLTFKKREDNRGYVLRLSNVSGETLVGATVKLPDSIQSIWHSNLLEKEKEALVFKNGRVILPAMTKDSFITLVLR